MSAADFTHDRPGTPAGRWRAHPEWIALRTIDPWEGVDRLVVVAAHPDDESLGAGGLLATAHDRGLGVQVLVLTDGEGSHPRSPTLDPERLAGLRRSEAHAAAHILGEGVEVGLLGLPDGGLAGRHDELVALLVEQLGDARDTLLVAPWRHDGHPDHEAAGRAAAAAAVRTGARLLEYPVWFWHWAEPDTAPWTALRSLPLEPDVVTRKAAAIDAHHTQVRPLSDAPGDEVLLGPDLLAHFAGTSEVVVEESAVDPSLDELHAEGADPWGVEQRWYERRKRDLTLAALPRARFDQGLEVGCSRGALAADLATRCRRLVALDRSPEAVRSARERLPSHVEVRVADLPADWPDDHSEGSFDLVVVSEVGYFLSPAALAELLDRIRRSLTPDGVVVMCHWRHPVRGWVLDGPAVHRLASAAGLPPERARYVDRDLELVVWSKDWPDPYA